MTKEQLPVMMKEFLEYDGTRPIVMECIVSSEHVYPMVPAGKALHEQIVSLPFTVCGAQIANRTCSCTQR